MDRGRGARGVVSLVTILAAMAIAAPLGAGWGATTNPDAETPAPMASAQTHLPPAFLLQWGSEGTGNGQFQAGHGVGAHESGLVYVSDQSLNRVQKFDSKGAYSGQWGSAGTAEGEFDHAWDVTVDSAGNVYVTDTDNHRVQKFDSSGSFVFTCGYGVSDGTSVFQICASGCQAGHDGGGPGSFYFPNGIAVDSVNKVYVGNRGKQRVVKLDNDGSYLTQWGAAGTAEGQFAGGPGSIAVDGDGFVITSEDTSARIQVFDSGGNFVRMWGWGVQNGTAEFQVCTSGCQAGQQGSGAWQFSSPTGLAVDPDNNIYVSDFGNGRVYKFDRRGTPLTTWDEGNGALNSPAGISIVGSSLYLVDRFNYRVLKYGGPYFETYVGEPEPGAGG